MRSPTVEVHTRSEILYCIGAAQLPCALGALRAGRSFYWVSMRSVVADTRLLYVLTHGDHHRHAVLLKHRASAQWQCSDL